MELSCNRPIGCKLTVNALERVWSHAKRRQQLPAATTKRAAPVIKQEEREEEDGEGLTENMDKLKDFMRRHSGLIKARHAFVSKRILFILLYYALLYSGQYITLKDYIR